VETLRVWERRYAISAASRSAHGQRLYTAEQVQHLSLLKRVVDLGHAIGHVARLPTERLRDLAGMQRATAANCATPARAIRVVLVGTSMGLRLAGHPATETLDVLRSCASLNSAAQAFEGAQADILLIEAPELSASVAPLIVALRRQTGVSGVVVLYRFSSSANIRLLREEGCLVARTPSDPAEVAMLCSAALSGPQPQVPTPPPLHVLSAVPGQRPRIDERTLSMLANLPNNVQCECPRHLAEILLMLGSFERYCGECANRDSSDAALHVALGTATAQARERLEAAMDQITQAEGFHLPAANGA
jgi:hypothetical protein